MPRHALLLIAALLLARPHTLDAQTTGTEKEERIDISGVLFANYHYRTDPSARHANRFDLERAYLTARADITDRLNVRVTTDVFQQQSSSNDGFYRGWVIRAKYAYLHYDAVKPEQPAEQLAVGARIGMLQTVMIEHLETFWPRWLGITADERAGYFASADVGAAGVLSLPNRLGEVYTTITNGPGYTSREIDRFKDYAARITITPFATGGPGPLRTLALSAWGYKGALASRFVNGGPGQIAAVGSSLRRDRWGLLAGVRDSRITGAIEYSQRIDESEVGNNTAISPRSVIDSTGRLFSTFAIVRPFQLADTSNRTPLRLIGRLDDFRPARGSDGDVRFIVAGAIWDLARSVSMALDYQEQISRGSAAAATTKTWFLHVVAGF